METTYEIIKTGKRFFVRSTTGTEVLESADFNSIKEAQKSIN